MKAFPIFASVPLCLFANSHFFIEEEIELDVDPREVTTQQHMDSVLKFMAELGSILKHDVILTEENGPEHIWFEYEFDIDRIRYIGN